MGHADLAFAFTLDMPFGDPIFQLLILESRCRSCKTGVPGMFQEYFGHGVRWQESPDLRGASLRLRRIFTLSANQQAPKDKNVVQPLAPPDLHVFYVAA